MERRILDDYTPEEVEEVHTSEWISIPYSNHHKQKFVQRPQSKSFHSGTKETYIGSSWNASNEDLGFRNYRVYTKSLFNEHFKAWQTDVEGQLTFLKDVIVTLVRESVEAPLKQVKKITDESKDHIVKLEEDIVNMVKESIEIPLNKVKELAEDSKSRLDRLEDKLVKLDLVEDRITKLESKTDEVLDHTKNKTSYWKKKAIDLEERCNALERENHRHNVKDAISLNRMIRRGEAGPFIPTHSKPMHVKTIDLINEEDL